jgi:phage prohead protease, HK97 family
VPYFIWDESPTCSGWAVVKSDGEEMSCHSNKQEAIEAMVGISVAEGIEPGGTYTEPESDTEELGDETANLRSEACQDCDRNCEVCKEVRQVNLTPPAYMRAAARQGLRYYEEGKAGDGLVEATVREARAMAAGNVTADKWVRIAAWIARHLDNLDSPAARPDSPDYPSAGVVAHLLWGSGPSKASARRALEYAQGVVSRIEEENEGRAKGEALSKMETRTNITQIEVREEGDGMTFTGYAAVFDSPSEPLPFIETIQRGAFRKSLRARNDIKFLWNHDAGEILGSTRAKTLRLYEDERGLRVEGNLPNTSRGRDVAELLRRGDIDSMSFGFSVIRDDWSGDGSQRTLKDVRLHEVSLVAWPAYTATSGTVAVRGLDKIAERSGVDADALADALLKVEDGQTITTEESEMLSRVIGELAPKQEVVEPKGDFNALSVKKAKLDLLIKGII